MNAVIEFFVKKEIPPPSLSKISLVLVGLELFPLESLLVIPLEGNIQACRTMEKMRTKKGKLCWKVKERL